MSGRTVRPCHWLHCRAYSDGYRLSRNETIESTSSPLDGPRLRNYIVQNPVNARLKAGEFLHLSKDLESTEEPSRSPEGPSRGA